MPEPRDWQPEEVKPGLSAEFERDITEEDILTFARLSGDANPLHVDAAYAAGTNYQRRIVHGAFQVGLASAMVGMHLPGKHVLLGSVNAKFPTPLVFPCRVRVQGTVVSWNASAQAGTLKVVVHEAGQQVPTAEIFLGFTFHQQRAQAPHPVANGLAAEETDRPIVLVTGASGGVGTTLAAELARDYTVLAQHRSNALPEALQNVPHVHAVEADLQSPTCTEAFDAVLQGRPLYGVVHAAWPGHPHGSLLQTDDQVIEQQLSFGATRTIALARYLFSHVGSEGGRCVVLGSIAGVQKPMLTFASYSLGKATLEHTVKLLAPELARKQVTINIANPAFIPTGMNKQTNDRQRLKEAALVPLGRLCQPEDVAGLVRYLLSPSAAFISGQAIGLTGAQL